MPWLVSNFISFLFSNAETTFTKGEHSRLDSEHADAIGTTDCGGTRLYHFGGRFGPLIMVDVVMMLMKVLVVVVTL